MSPARYFSLGQIAGSPHTRFAILDGHRVVQIVASRPDGIEIERPANVRMALQPFGSGPIAAPYWNNVRAAALSQARSRAGEAGKRALAERRAQRLMPGGETDEKLALGRQRGAFRKAAA